MCQTKDPVKGLTGADIRHVRIDNIMGSVAMGVIAVAIVIGDQPV